MDLKLLKVNMAIDQKDGMAKGTREQYFKTGKDGLRNIIDAISTSSIRSEDVEAVLDYACGYGRVLRWLQAAFPGAAVNGLDVDKSAVASARRILGVDVDVLDPSLPKELDKKYDIIWVGSLFTHLPESEMRRVLRFLCQQLTDRGVLVFTAHEQFVFDRLRVGEKTYNLSADGQAKLLKEYVEGGFAFSPYPKADGYGISISRPAVVLNLVDDAGLSPVFFKARGWVNHQDVYGCIRV